MKRLLILATLAVAALFGGGVATASAGCLSKIDTGAKAFYDPGFGTGMAFDSYSAGANCTTTNSNHYHVNWYMEQWNGSAWVQSASYPATFRSPTFVNNVANKYWRRAFIDGDPHAVLGEYSYFWPCSTEFSSSSTLVRLRQVVVNEDTGTTDQSVSTSASKPATCHT